MRDTTLMSLGRTTLARMRLIASPDTCSTPLFFAMSLSGRLLMTISRHSFRESALSLGLLRALFSLGEEVLALGDFIAGDFFAFGDLFAFFGEEGGFFGAIVY